MNNRLKTWIANVLGYNDYDPLITRIKVKEPHDTNYILSRNPMNLTDLEKLWVFGKSIRLFVDPSIPKNERVPYINAVKSGIEELVDELSLDFSVRSYGIDVDVNNYIKECMNGNFLDPNKLGEILAHEKHRKPPFGTPHSDVIISKKPLSTNGWGYGNFWNGSIIIGYNSLDYKKLKTLAKHEATHLFGNRHHHGLVRFFGEPGKYEEYVRKKGLLKPNQTYAELKCVGTYNLRSDSICPQCYDSLIGIWLSYEKRYRKGFFKISKE